jgi:tRNA modification GTPase
MSLETIAAISTPPGIGGVGMIRISGAEAPEIAGRLFRRGKSGKGVDLRQQMSHQLIYGRIVDPATERQVDEVMLAWMAAPKTYTTEETVEIYCHGGPVPLQESLRLVLAAGARHAEPGEFTLRAFLNGRLDLTQAEAVLQVVGARTAEGLRLAVDDLRGDLSRRIAPARDALVSLLAYLDAAADFPEDEIPAIDIDADLATAVKALRDVVAGSRAGLLYREGAQVALVGRPNVGKSSLLNALLRSDRAIVTPIAGTTRDVIAETAQINGIPVTLLDTAGIAESADVVEQLGIERSRKALTAAAAAILVLDGSVSPTEDDLQVARLLAGRLETTGYGLVPVVIAINKQDLAGQASQRAVIDLLPDATVVAISSQTGDGIGELEAAISQLLLDEAIGGARPSLITARQFALLDRSLTHLENAAATRAAAFPLDLMASDVRASLRSLGEVTGEEVSEAVLTEIFGRFCIGK